ncbi:MAG: hypothetical protein KGM44_13125, partial [bacterium]|nr:hypothetical protein [bacterium]
YAGAVNHDISLADESLSRIEKLDDQARAYLQAGAATTTALELARQAMAAASTSAAGGAALIAAHTAWTYALAVGIAGDWAEAHRSLLRARKAFTALDLPIEALRCAAVEIRLSLDAGEPKRAERQARALAEVCRGHGLDARAMRLESIVTVLSAGRALRPQTLLWLVEVPMRGKRLATVDPLTYQRFAYLLSQRQELERHRKGMPAEVGPLLDGPAVLPALRTALDTARLASSCACQQANCRTYHLIHEERGLPSIKCRIGGLLHTLTYDLTGQLHDIEWLVDGLPDETPDV